MDYKNNSTIPLSPEIQNIIGGVMLLTRHSPLHLLYSVSEWQQRIVTSLLLNQFRYYETKNGKPIAFCNWALLSNDNLAALISGERDININDWQSGDNLFFPEMIAPYGHARLIATDLRRNIFLYKKGDIACALRGRIYDKDCEIEPKIQWFTI
ncbi:cytolysin-activating lysine-acyltransferase rtxC [Yersinia frederiksenii]|nr:cytolysin-activating lysine-acyltransferase rtxC [Yersinia frederiksenii]